MRPKTSGVKLPPRMLARKRKLKSGEEWVGYYYNGRNPDGKRVEISLGTDLAAAKRKWAELECKPVPEDASLMSYVFSKYESDILPTKGAGTQRVDRGYLRQLRAAFDKAPVDAIKPSDIARYRDARSAKVSANREITLLSHVFNMAREWGFTTRENPCRGVRKNKERPRDYYAEDDVWKAVHKKAVRELQDAMDLNYLTGQRPSDVLKMTTHDIRDDELRVRQNKGGKLLRIRLTHDGKRTQLGTLLDRLVARAEGLKSRYLVTDDSGQKLSYSMLRRRYDSARSAAAAEAAEREDEELEARIKQFWFKDIRPKAASEIVDLREASDLLGHTNTAITKRVYRRKGEVAKPTK
jgi:integrase